MLKFKQLDIYNYKKDKKDWEIIFKIFEYYKDFGYLDIDYIKTNYKNLDDFIDEKLVKLNKLNEKERKLHTPETYTVYLKDKCIGYIDFKPKRNIHEGAIGMGIVPDYKGKGYGYKILSTFIDMMFEKHGKWMKKLCYLVYDFNNASLALQRKLKENEKYEVVESVFKNHSGEFKGKKVIFHYFDIYKIK